MVWRKLRKSCLTIDGLTHSRMFQQKGEGLHVRLQASRENRNQARAAQLAHATPAVEGDRCSVYS